MIKLELSNEVAADVVNLCTRELSGYTTNEDHLPERIKSLREAVETITTQLDNND